MLEKAPALGRGKTGVLTARREVECFYMLDSERLDTRTKNF